MGNKKKHIDQIVSQALQQGSQKPSKKLMKRISKTRKWKYEWKQYFLPALISVLITATCIFHYCNQIENKQTKATNLSSEEDQHFNKQPIQLTSPIQIEERASSKNDNSTKATRTNELSAYTESLVQDYLPSKGKVQIKKESIRKPDDTINASPKFVEKTYPHKQPKLHKQEDSQSLIDYSKDTSQIIAGSYYFEENRSPQNQPIDLILENDSDGIWKNSGEMNNQNKPYRKNNLTPNPFEDTPQKDKNENNDKPQNDFSKNSTNDFCFNIGINAGFETAIGKFKTTNLQDETFIAQENKLLKPSTSFNYGLNLSLGYKNLNLITGIHNKTDNFRLNYSQLPDLYDTTLQITLNNHDVWNMIYIIDTTGQPELVDSVFSHSVSDTTKEIFVTNTPAPDQNEAIQISYLCIPVNLSYDFQIKKHTLSPLLGISFNIPYKSSGMIRQENYKLANFSEHYQLKKINLQLNAEIAYAYQIKPGWDIYLKLAYSHGLSNQFTDSWQRSFIARRYGVNVGLRVQIF